MIDVYADPAMKNALEGLIAAKKERGELVADDLVVVPLQNHEGRLSESNGLNKVLELAPSGKTIIMFSMLSPLYHTDKFPPLANDSRFQGAMGYPNVVLTTRIDYASHLDELAAEAGARPRDELAIELAEHLMPQQMLSILKHDATHLQDGSLEQNAERQERWQKLAKELYGDLPMEELLAKVEEGKQEFKQEFDGRELDGIFVDVEGTLLQDGLVNKQLLEELRERAKTAPITVWTDGDISKLSNDLRDAGVDWKIVPKEYFRGARVPEVYDDLSAEEFESKYGIRAEKHNHIQPLSPETQPGRVV